jgi:hypothetical protein
MEENRKETINSGEIVENYRNPDGTFKEGHPKLGGKELGSKSFTTKVREALEKIAEGKDYTYEEAFIKSILKKAIVDGDSQIMRLIWNYLDGMPMQKTDITSDGKPIYLPSELINKNEPPQCPENDS